MDRGRLAAQARGTVGSGSDRVHVAADSGGTSLLLTCRCRGSKKLATDSADNTDQEGQSAGAGAVGRSRYR